MSWTPISSSRKITLTGAETMNDQIFIDRIYQAAVVPETWQLILDDIGKQVGAEAGGVALLTGDGWFDARYSQWLDPTLHRYKSTNTMFKSQFIPRNAQLNHAGFLRVCDVYEDEREFLADPLMTDFFGPLGLRHPAATFVRLPTGNIAAVEFWRRNDQPPFAAEDIAWLDSLRPHFCRAVLLAAQWRLEQLRAAVQALTLLGLPAAVLNTTGRVLAANELIQSMRSCVTWLPDDRIALKNKNANALFRRALVEAAPPSTPMPRSIPCPGAGEPMIAHLIPVTGRARDVFVGAHNILVMTAITHAASPQDVVLRGLYDLTPAEARVARGIGEGLDLPAISRQYEVSAETVRTQAKAIYAKTGAGGKPQLVRLLAALTSVPIA
jgi:DNA-binding CsgD family transcriptional regulator